MKSDVEREEKWRRLRKGNSGGISVGGEVGEAEVEEEKHVRGKDAKRGGGGGGNGVEVERKYEVD